MKRLLLFISAIIFSISSIFAQFGADPLSWSFSLEDKGGGEVEVIATVSIERGWYIYDITMDEGGPNPTAMSIDKLSGAEKVGDVKVIDSKLETKYDEVFKMNIGYYKNHAKFAQRLKITNKDAFLVEGDIRAQACTDETCLPPLAVDFNFSGKDLAANFTAATIAPSVEKLEEIATPEVAETGAEENVETIETVAPVQDGELVNALWEPVIDELKLLGEETLVDKALIWMFILGIGGGLIALVTPCVWPLIPMTVSFFLKRNKKNKKKAVIDALIYGLGIIIIYVLLGLIVTAIFGASALNDLSTNKYFNLLFAGLLILFAVSFLGAFEIVLPSSWANKIDRKAESTTGIISIFLMAFTLTLVSFSCTGPVIGTVLVQAASSGAILGPAVVMFGFALALAIPFSLFALFPSWLESLPKSGGWLNTVKVVLGFLELALALKFLSVADMAYEWGLLDREVFLALWIVIFGLLGLYLLGKLRFPHDDKIEKLSVGRFFMALVPLAFTIYLIPGLWGAPLKSISAFSPLMTTQDFNLYDGSVHAKFDDYEAGMAYAKRENKPVMLDFTGYGCVNCREMEQKVWTDASIKSMLENDYVLITLYVDLKRELPETIEIEENGKKRKLKTVGDKWSYLQQHKFGYVSQPYYVLLDYDGKPLVKSYAYDTDVEKYREWLRSGLKAFKERHSK